MVHSDWGGRSLGRDKTSLLLSSQESCFISLLPLPSLPGSYKIWGLTCLCHSLKSLTLAQYLGLVTLWDPLPQSLQEGCWPAPWDLHSLPVPSTSFMGPTRHNQSSQHPCVCLILPIRQYFIIRVGLHLWTHDASLQAGTFQMPTAGSLPSKHQPQCGSPALPCPISPFWLLPPTPIIFQSRYLVNK